MGAPGNLAWLSTDQYSQEIANVAGETYPEYIGECHPKNQHLPANSVWRIKKILYNLDWTVASVRWADRSKNFNFQWTQRATYNYA